jgi:hypothetical protein
MTDPALLSDILAKLREMQEQLSVAEQETTPQSILRSRVRHLSILAHYVRARLEIVAKAESLPPKPDDTLPDATDRP